MCLVYSCDWSLLPSTVFDVLTCVFTARMSHNMRLSIPEKPGSAAHSSTSTASAELLHLLVGALVHLVLQELPANVCGCCHPSMSTTHHKYWHPWVGTNWSHAAQNTRVSLPRLWPESSSVAMEKWVGSNALLYQWVYQWSETLMCSWCGMSAVYNHQVRTSWNNSSVSHCTLQRMSWRHLGVLSCANLKFLNFIISHSTWHWVLLHLCVEQVA